MAEVRNLELDLDGSTARVAVVDVHGYTRPGDPVISVGCESFRALGREIERLKGELDAILQSARNAFGVPASVGSDAKQESAVSAPTASPSLDASLRVRDVMTREVKTVRRNDRISLAEELMRAGRFRHVVVLDDQGRVSGVVSHRDIVYGALAWTLGQGRAAHDKALESFPVKDVMATGVLTVDSETPLGEAATSMRTHQIGCLPVVDADELVGILTEADFLYLLTS